MRGRMPRTITVPTFKYAKELAYIQSSGTQFIDTKYYPTQNTKVEATAEYLAGDNYPMVCGYYVNASNTFAIFYTASTWRGWFGSAVVYFAGNYASGKHDFSLDKAAFSVDATSTAVSAGSFTATLPMYIFAMKQSSAVYYHSTIRLYGLKIYESGELVRDYIPVLDNDGVACLYDKVTEELLYNGGTGSFSYGEV